MKKTILITMSILVFGGAAFWLFSYEKALEPDFSAEKVSIVAPGGRIEAEIAATPQARERGLSGRDGLCADCGMLFIFEKKDKYAFWMKDMKFDLDMIWLDGNRIMRIDRNVSHLQGEAEIRKPEMPIDRVLEISAGGSDQFGLEIGGEIAIR